MYYVYLIRCRDGSHYTGMAKELSKRMKEHAERGGACARYTRAHPIEALAAAWQTDTRSNALRLEALIKTLTKQQKLALIAQPELLADIFGEKLKGAQYSALRGITLDACLNE